MIHRAAARSVRLPETRPGTAAGPTVASTLSAIMVTHNRPDVAWVALQSCLDQTVPPTRVVVVDNGDIPFQLKEKDVVGGVEIEVLRPGSNIGPAGGIPLAAEHLARRLSRDKEHFVVLIDDDDPFLDPTCVEVAVALLSRGMGDANPVLGVGFRGSLFDRKRMRTAKPGADVPVPVVVDSLHGGFCAVYRLQALLNVPHWIRALFWGFEELALGLHIRSTGGQLLSLEDPTVIACGKTERLRSRPSLKFVAQPTLHRYYTLRNLVVIQQRYGPPGVAVVHGFVRGVLKPLVVFPFQPRWAARALAYGLRALLDGLGRRLPLVGSPTSRPGCVEFLRNVHLKIGRNT